MKRKAGALSTEEKKYISENASRLSVQSIADYLNRSSTPILRFIKESGLASIDQIDNIDETYQEILDKLKKSIFYEELKHQLDQDELNYFQAHWVDLMMQFKQDVLPSEGMQIKELIILDILNNRIMRKRLAAKKDVERLQKLLNDEYNQLPQNRNHENIAMMEAQLSLAKTADSNLSNESTKINADKKKLFTDLKGTRDQRFSKVESGEKTFMTLLKALYEEDQRRKEGEAAYLIKLATEKKRQELFDYHTFGDGQLDIPILNAESVQKKKEEESEEVQGESTQEDQ